MGSKDVTPKCTGPPLAALEASEREAIGKVIEGLRPEVEGWLHKHGAYDWEIDDAFADACSKVWSGESLDVTTLHNPKNIRTVLFTAAKFVLKDVFLARKEEEMLDQYDDDDRRKLASGEDPHALAQLRETQAARERACASLPEEQRAVLRLADEGYKVWEIAELSGSSENTVKTHLKRARRTVRERMRAEGFAPDEMEEDEDEDEDEY